MIITRSLVESHFIVIICNPIYPLQWHHIERNGISNHQRLNCLVNRLFRSRAKKILKLRVISLCEGNLLMTSEFPAHRASNAENVSIWWRHHVVQCSRDSHRRHITKGYLLVCAYSNTSLPHIMGLFYCHSVMIINKAYLHNKPRHFVDDILRSIFLCDFFIS